MKNVANYLVLLLINACLINSSYATNSVDHSISEDQKLTNIIEIHEAFYLESNPFNQPDVLGNNAKLPELSADFLLAKYQKGLVIYQQLSALDDKKLTQENQINFSVLSYSLKNKLDS